MATGAVNETTIKISLSMVLFIAVRFITIEVIHDNRYLIKNSY